MSLDVLSTACRQRHRPCGTRRVSTSTAYPAFECILAVVPHPLVSISETAGGHEGRWECQPHNAYTPVRVNAQFFSAEKARIMLEVLEVLEVDILWPRWVARIGVTRATEACFLTADRQCTELPLLRLPRLVPEVVGCDPFVPRDLARVGWRGLRKARKHALRLPLLPIGPHERPRLADSFPRLGQARGASPGSLDQRSEEWPLCEGKSGALGVRLARPPPRGEGNCGVD